MSSDEFWLLIIAAVVAGIGWFRWYRHANQTTTLAGATWARRILLLIPPLCPAALLLVLRCYSDPEVRSHWVHQWLFVSVGAVALLGVNLVAGLWGLEILDDGLLMGNRGTIWSVGGAWVAITLCVAGRISGKARRSTRR